MTENNDILLRVLKGQKVTRTPLWVMRQAGRYLPEYRRLRQSAGDFMKLCKTPELACQITLQPLQRFRLDAAILFSDILTIPDAMGLDLVFTEGGGPQFNNPLRDIHDIDALTTPNVNTELSYVLETLGMIRRELNNSVPLIGFSGSPWTLACYMVEGKTSYNFQLIKSLLYGNPQNLRHLLEKITVTVIEYLEAQIAAGAQAIMIFDSWGGVLTSAGYEEFSLNYINHIVAELKAQAPDIPLILFTKGGGLWLEALAASGCDALALDWTVDMNEARQRVGSKVVLQGNLDPAVMNGTSDAVAREAQAVLCAYGEHDDQCKGHIFNLGHGIQPHARIDNVHALVDTVHDYSRQFHGN